MEQVNFTTQDWEVIRRAVDALCDNLTQRLKEYSDTQNPSPEIMRELQARIDHIGFLNAKIWRSELNSKQEV